MTRNLRTPVVAVLVSALALSAGPAPVAAVAAHQAPARPVTFSDTFDRANSGTVGNGWTLRRGDWSISGNKLVSTGATTERVIANSGFQLGRTFELRANLGIYDSGDSKRWSGVAFNVRRNPDGTFDYLAIRLAKANAENSGEWQFLRVFGSAIDNRTSLIDGGRVRIAANQDYSIRVSSTTTGVFDFRILSGTSQVFARPVVAAPLSKLLVNGHVGFYTGAGGLRVADLTVSTSAEPAPPPPAPGPLRCTPVDGPAYELPDRPERVASTVPVGTTWAGHRVGQALLTAGDDQYVAYYDGSRQMTVAQRRTGGTAWVRRTLPSTLVWDSHNSVTMAVDRAGHLHVSGNMHGVPLVYFRTTTVGDVRTLTRVATMVDATLEQRVTYPAFRTSPDGALLFRYRNGSSGEGEDRYNVYDEQTRTWRAFLGTPLLSGGTERGVYVESSGPVRGPDGMYHLVWVWRNTNDAATNERLSYARSRDLLSWETSTGQPLTLPITYATAEIVDPVPMNGGMINRATRTGFDAQGRILITYHKYDAAGNTQLYLARRGPGDQVWQISQVTNWTGRWDIHGGGTLAFEVTVSPVQLLPDGNLRLDYTCHGVARSLVLAPDTLRPFAEVATPALPVEVTTPRSTFPGIQVQTSGDLGGPGPDSRYLLRWESLGVNGDAPRDVWPAAQPLEVYELRTD